MSRHSRTIGDIYNLIPKIDCKGLCHESCGPVPATRAEVEAIEKAGGVQFGIDATNHCSMLFAGRCTVYPQRPLLCRLWGVVRKMSCPWGCVPERWLSDAEGAALLHRMTSVGSGYDHERLASMLQSVANEIGMTRP